jgi:hypothetical protein
MYGDPKEHYRDLASWAHHKCRDDQDKLATWHEMFWRTTPPILEFYRIQNQVWMIEFSYGCDFMLHNAWLDIPCVFIHFIEMISDKHT